MRSRIGVERNHTRKSAWGAGTLAAAAHRRGGEWRTERHTQLPGNLGTRFSADRAPPAAQGGSKSSPSRSQDRPPHAHGLVAVHPQLPIVQPALVLGRAKPPGRVCGPAGCVDHIGVLWHRPIPRAIDVRTGHITAGLKWW